ncbi:MAG: TIGR00269 family protein [Candidatus Diapherotrites archaeon]
MTSEKCDKCSKKAVINLAYGSHRFCAEHFNEFFEKRVRKTIRKHRLIKSGEKIAIGVSGGKDSMVALHMLNKSLKKGNEITAIMVDEGIPKYRDVAIKLAVEECGKIGVAYEKVSFEELYGLTNIEIMKKISKDKSLGSSCAFCGVLRRDALNKTALKIGADKIATGHNLDDETQSILMNFFDNDWKRMSRLGAISSFKKTKEFVPRIKPLYETPEEEIILYAEMNGINYYKGQCCPFRWMAKRNEFRNMLDTFESKFPGTKYSVLQSFETIKPNIQNLNKNSELKKCKKCGNPSSSDVCQVCKQIEKIKN